MLFRSANTINNVGIRTGLSKELGRTFLLEVDAAYTNKNNFYYQPYYSTAEAGQGTYPSITPSFTNYTGWQANFTPRIKANFGSLGTSILGYEFNKGNQSSTDTYSAIMNQVAPGQGAVSNPLFSYANASLYNQSLYFIEKFPISSSVDLNGGYRYQTQSATTNGASIWNNSGAITPNATYSASAGDVALNYKYMDGQRIFIKWDQSYRFPNIDEFWTWSNQGGSPSFGRSEEHTSELQSH